MKNHHVKYGIISRDNMTTITYFPTAFNVSAHLWGRRIDRHIILKITNDDCKVVKLQSCDCGTIEKELEEA